MGEVTHGQEQGSMGNLCTFYCEPKTALENKVYLKDYIVEKNKGNWVSVFSFFFQLCKCHFL